MRMLTLESRESGTASSPPLAVGHRCWTVTRLGSVLSILYASAPSECLRPGGSLVSAKGFGAPAIGFRNCEDVDGTVCARAGVQLRQNLRKSIRVGARHVSAFALERMLLDFRGITGDQGRCWGGVCCLLFEGREGRVGWMD